ALPAWLQSSKIESMLPYTSWALPRSGMCRNNKRELAHEVVTGWKLVSQVDRLCVAELLMDGASCSIIVEDGEPLKSVFTGGITSTIGAISSGT
nr:hypothetical protein [Tanacetum cinerariifolium]